MSVKEITKSRYNYSGYPQERMWKLINGEGDIEITVFADEDAKSMQAIDWTIRKADDLGYFDYSSILGKYSDIQVDWLGIFSGDCLNHQGQKAKWPLMLSVVTGYDSELDKILEVLTEFNPPLKYELELFLRKSTE